MNRMNIFTIGATGCILLTALSACATQLPLAPSFTVLPRQGESFEVFQKHDVYCRSYALNNSDQSSLQHPQDDRLASAAVGAGVGAAAGALLGSAGGHAGNGAAAGAGAGLLFGSLAGAQSTQQAHAAVQRRYDTAFAQCMTAYGEQVPIATPPPRVIYITPPPPPVVMYPAG